MRIGILTGGGDVPGLNPCIKAVVNRATDAGHEVVGIRRGWGGLLNFNIDDPTTHEEQAGTLTKNDVRTIDRYGGTHLHSSRTNPAKVSRSMMPEFLASQYPFAEGQKSVDCTAACAAGPRVPRHRYAGADRWRRYIVLCAAHAPGRYPCDGGA